MTAYIASIIAFYAPLDDHLVVTNEDRHSSWALVLTLPQ
jgi:hypothetical protein